MPVEDSSEVVGKEMIRSLVADSLPYGVQKVGTLAGDVWILIADDEPDMLRLVRFRPERCGWKILDIVIPKADGFDVLEALRADNDLADTKVIMLTARGSDDDITRSHKLGADDYITKPFGPRELEMRVRAHLYLYGKRRAGRPARVHNTTRSPQKRHGGRT